MKNFTTNRFGRFVGYLPREFISLPHDSVFRVVMFLIVPLFEDNNSLYLSEKSVIFVPKSIIEIKK